MEEGKFDPRMEKVIDESTQNLGDEISRQLNEELNKLRLKPFDLQKAKAGKPVCTRDGRKARIICFDKIDVRPILALVKSNDGKGEMVFDYFISGKRIAINSESDLDLMMLPEKKEGWINVYKTNAGNILLSKNPYKTYKEAFDNRTNYFDTVKITCEE